MAKITVHSTTSLITNSSTTIYTKSDCSIEPFKALINEMLSLMGIDKTCDDIFDVKIVGDEGESKVWDMVFDNVYNESEGTEDLLLPDGEPDEEKITQLLDDVNSGKIDAPYWLEEIKSCVSSNSAGGTSLEITTKDPKYENLAQLAIEFLYSTEAVEGEHT